MEASIEEAAQKNPMLLLIVYVVVNVMQDYLLICHRINGYLLICHRINGEREKLYHSKNAAWMQYPRLENHAQSLGPLICYR
jgi:hypothetical protein